MHVEPEFRISMATANRNKGRIISFTSPPMVGSLTVNANNGAIMPKSTRSHQIFDPDTWFEVHSKLIKDFGPGYDIISIENVVNPVLHERFEKRREEMAVSNAKVIPLMCYHGTRLANHDNIVAQGLVVPGRGNRIAVANGSVHGLGIYLAIKPSLSMGYTQGENTMFACAVLLGNRSVIANNGTLLVITHPAQVLVCYVVRWKAMQPGFLAKHIDMTNAPFYRAPTRDSSKKSHRARRQRERRKGNKNK